MKPFRLGNEDVAVVKLGDAFFAFSDFCTHEAITLTGAYGHVARDFVVCMMHSSWFDIETGEVLSGPAPDPLEIFEVRVEGNNVFVGPQEG